MSALQTNPGLQIEILGSQGKAQSRIEEGDGDAGYQVWIVFNSLNMSLDMSIIMLHILKISN